MKLLTNHFTVWITLRVKTMLFWQVPLAHSWITLHHTRVTLYHTLATLWYPGNLSVSYNGVTLCHIWVTRDYNSITLRRRATDCSEVPFPYRLPCDVLTPSIIRSRPVLEYPKKKKENTIRNICAHSLIAHACTLRLPGTLLFWHLFPFPPPLAFSSFEMGRPSPNF
jgi:hypothetical protein